MDCDHGMVKLLGYFSEHQGHRYVTTSLMPPIGPPSVNRSERRCETYIDPNDLYARYKEKH